jgi:hypothetical protein
MHDLRTQKFLPLCLLVAVEFTMAPSALPQCIASGMEFVAQICENLLLKTAEAEAVRKIFCEILHFLRQFLL